jgi:type VI secretion system protein ImpL
MSSGRRWLVGLALAGIVIAGALGAVHVSNQRLADGAGAVLAAATSAAPAAGSAPEDPGVALPALEALASSPLPTGELPWWRRPALNAAALDRLAAEQRQLDRHLLGDAFLQRFAAGILDRIDRPDVAPELAFDGLKVLLSLAGSGPRQDARIRLWAGVEWSLGAPDRRDRLLQQLDRALAAEPRLATALDAATVERIRDRLRQAPLATRAYAAIRTSEATQHLPAFRPDQALGSDGWAVIRRSGQSLAAPIPGLLTATGFQQVVTPALADISASLQSDAWVLGGNTAPEATGRSLTEAVLALYLADVSQAWDALLDDIDIAPSPADSDGAGRMIAALTTSPGPLLRLALAARQATLFDVAQGAAAGRLDALARALGGTRPWAAIDRRYTWLLPADSADLPGFAALVDAARPFIDRAGSLPRDRTQAGSGLD